jgi:hypothetical protein
MLQLRGAECSETLHRTSNCECVQTAKSYVWEEHIIVFSPIHVPTENGWAMANLLLVWVPLFKMHLTVNHNQYVESMTGTNSRVPFGVGTPDYTWGMQWMLSSLNLFANRSHCSSHLRLLCAATLSWNLHTLTAKCLESTNISPLG